MALVNTWGLKMSSDTIFVFAVLIACVVGVVYLVAHEGLSPWIAYFLVVVFVVVAIDFAHNGPNNSGNESDGSEPSCSRC